MSRAGWLAAIGLVSITACEMEPALGTTEGRPLVVQVEHAATSGPTLVGGAAAAEAVRLQVTSNSADVTYRTEWTVGSSSCVRVVPRSGEPVIHRGSPMAVHYHHHGRMVGVAIGPDGQQELHSYVEPVSFSTIPCP
ncbi:MAG: hypothetical protein KF729_37300 [Sandaracinaceae bacterium]|nr:hypothetical protein [Sandaracinaceae bacterium]